MEATAPFIQCSVREEIVLPQSNPAKLGVLQQMRRVASTRLTQDHQSLLHVVTPLTPAGTSDLNTGFEVLEFIPLYGLVSGLKLWDSALCRQETIS